LKASLSWIGKFLFSPFERPRANVLVQADPESRSGPGATLLELLADGSNPIHELIDHWRLPRCEKRAQVAARAGVERDPLYLRPSILLPEAMSLPGAMTPWSANAFAGIPPQFPIGHFQSHVWFEDDAHVNVLRTADHIAAHLGPVTVGRRWNMFECTWICGRAELRLVAFPSEWQTHHLRNEVHEREPRLQYACRVSVVTGAVQPLSIEEKAWVASFRPLHFKGTVGSARIPAVGVPPPSETEMEYARDASSLPPDTQSALGLSADNEALIVISHQLFVMDRRDIMLIEVQRLTPARGSGGSLLYAHCRTEAPDTQSRTITLGHSRETDGLNELAEELGRLLRCPVEIGLAYPDI
jgi:hypothetical protein